MTALYTDAEKATLAYSDDATAPPQTTADLPYLTRIRKQRSRWFSWKTLFLLVVIVGLIVARGVEGPIRARIHKNKLASKQATHPVSAVAPSPIEDAPDAVTSHPAHVSHLEDLNEPSEEIELAEGTTVGVSIAASVDGDGNRQVYDLDSEGQIRVRKIEHDTYRYSKPEVVDTSRAPQKGSPLAAIAWRGADSSIEHRLAYLTKENYIVYASGTSANATAPTTNWKILNVIAVQAFGGLSMLNIGPRYDPNTNAGQIRILFVEADGTIRHLNTAKDVWYIGYTGFKAAPGSDVSINAARDDKGQVTNIGVIYTDPNDGLKEFLCDEKNKRNEYVAGRPVDPAISSEFPSHYTSVFGGPPASSRVYILNQKSPAERTAPPGSGYTTTWWQTADDSWYVPEVVGGSVGAVAWNDKEVRVFFKGKAAKGKLTEVGLSAQAGAGTKWFGRGYIN